MLRHPTLDLLTSLGLDGMAKAFTELEGQPEVGSLSHPEWLALLLDREVTTLFSDNHRDRCRQPRWPVAAGVGRA